jgi:serine/threonine-protein kinase RsbT
MARSLGFGEMDSEQIALSVTELANNLWLHASSGTLHLRPVEHPRAGIEVSTVDEGPGIMDVERVLADGVSSRGGLGSGLPAVRRLMDELRIESVPGGQTRIEAIKWRS